MAPMSQSEVSAAAAELIHIPLHIGNHQAQVLGDCPAPSQGNDVQNPAQGVTVVSELWAGTLSFFTAMEKLASPVHTVKLQAYSESDPVRRKYSQLVAPSAVDVGPYSTSIHEHMAGSDVLTAGFECAPYVKCGKQLLNKDPRSEQVQQTVECMLDVAPHISAWENADEFFELDWKHHLYTNAKQSLSSVLHPYPPIQLCDLELGGCLCRPRTIALWESLDMFAILPPWDRVQLYTGSKVLSWCSK